MSGGGKLGSAGFSSSVQRVSYILSNPAPTRWRVFFSLQLSVQSEKRRSRRQAAVARERSEHYFFIFDSAERGVLLDRRAAARC